MKTSQKASAAELTGGGGGARISELQDAENLQTRAEGRKKNIIINKQLTREHLR